MPQTTYTIQLSRTALAYLAEHWGRAEHGHLWRDPAQGHKATWGNRWMWPMPTERGRGTHHGPPGTFCCLLFLVITLNTSLHQCPNLIICEMGMRKFRYYMSYESHRWKNLFKTTAAVPGGNICKVSNYSIFSYDYHLLLGNSWLSFIKIPTFLNYLLA